MHITKLSTALVKFDQHANYIPIVSSMTNLIDLFLKYAIRPFLSESTLENSHYFAYLDCKPTERCITLLIPVLGNLLIALLDAFDGPEGFEARAKECSGEEAQKLYLQAAQRGSAEAAYQLGKMTQKGYVDVPNMSILRPDQTSAKEMFRTAAALGHAEALVALNAPTRNEFPRFWPAKTV